MCDELFSRPSKIPPTSVRHYGSRSTSSLESGRLSPKFDAGVRSYRSVRIASDERELFRYVLWMGEMPAVRKRPRARTCLRRKLALSAALVLAVTMTACTGGTLPAPFAPPSASDRAPQLPLDSAALIASFERLAASMMVPGAAMLIRTPDGEVTATYGTTELGGSVPVSVDDHVRVGSSTKPWTATVILQLVQEGKIALADPVSKYRPDIPNGENITIEHLLNMRSGLFSYTETYQLLHEMDVDPQTVYDSEELLAIGVKLPPHFRARRGFLLLEHELRPARSDR